MNFVDDLEFVVLVVVKDMLCWGLVEEIVGNILVRCLDGNVVIMLFLVDYVEMLFYDLVLVDVGGVVLYVKDGWLLLIELNLYLVCYCVFDDIGSVIYSYLVWVIMFVVVYELIFVCIDEFVIYCGGDVCCIEYVVFGIFEVGCNVVCVFEGCVVVLIVNYGLVVVGFCFD